MDSLLQFEDHLSSSLDMAFPDANNNDDFDSSPSSVKEDKYSLRPRSMRRVTESLSKAIQEATPNTKPSKQHKPKQKAAPLSKYRRKTANARERNRMREINQAFETLRRVIPQMAANHVPSANEKLTKITTLRLAMKYISTLSAALTGPSDMLIPPPLSDCSDLDCLLLESDGESLPLSDHSLLTSPDFPESSPDFPESSLSPVDFGDPTLPPFLHTDFSDHTLEATDFSDFLLT